MRRVLRNGAAWVVLLASCAAVRASESVTVHGPAVVAGHELAAKAGLDVMKKGGNAIDALVATSMTLGVAEPGMSGMGGKLLVMYYDAKTKNVSFMVALNAAPLKLDVQDAIDAPSSRHSKGWKAACVPAMPAGLGAVHERWGSKPWKELVEPAAKLAEQGFILSAKDADMWEEFPTNIDPVAAKIYAPGGKVPVTGQRMTNPDLAKTMRIVANGGWKAFYNGEVAERFVASAQKAGWSMSMEDFSSYKPRWVEPVSFTYKGKKVFTGPPPLTGGATLMGTLKVLEGWDWGSEKPKSSRDPAFVDAFARAMLSVGTAVGRSAGDIPDSLSRVKDAFTDADILKLREAAKTMSLQGGGGGGGGGDATGMLPNSDLPALALGIEGSNDLLGDETPQGCTTPLIITDAQGNIVVATQSLGLHFGSGVVAEGTGVLLNSDMSNFAFKTKSSPNMIAPGKWPRSTIAPTLVLKDGKPLFAASGAGGARIPPAVGQVLADMLEFDRDALSAVTQSRFNPRRTTAGATVDIEGGMAPEVADYLKKNGWTIDQRTSGGLYFASVQVMKWAPDGKVTVAADRRRNSDAQGANIPD